MTSVEALQQTLAAEHVAVYAFGTLGGRAAALPAPRRLRICACEALARSMPLPRRTTSTRPVVTTCGRG